MKLCVAQTRPVTGNVVANIANHKRLISAAIAHHADVIIFPELSLTGYEPTLAKELATDKDDPRFNDFQSLSDSGKITVGVGMPLKYSDAVSIGVILFQPNQARQVYAKQYLHSDEDPFFVPAPNIALKIHDTAIALAICYEISVAEHTAAAFRNSPSIYIASVAKAVRGVDKALETLATTARKYGATVMMSNCIGACDGEVGGGKSAGWNASGIRVGELDDDSEGVLVLDTETQQVTIEYFEKVVQNLT